MKRKLGPLFVATLGVIFFFSSCKKENNNVGIDVQPPNDRIGVIYTDTVSVRCHSALVDSVRTDETSSSLLGSILDPVFGATTANIFSQFRLSKVASTFGDNPVLDSLILTLDYKSIYGDTNAVLTLEVFEISEKIFLDTNYYSNDAVGYYPGLIASKTFTPSLTDSVIVGPDTLEPHFRINLSETNPELAQKLLSASADVMNTQDSFQDYFYGLFLKVKESTGGGAILSMELVSAMTEMQLYYSNDESDSLLFTYHISTSAASFGQFLHNYTVAQPIFQAQVIEGDTSLGKTTCYIQAMAGVKSIIRFPHLRSLVADGKVAVNEARLFIKLQEAEPTLSPARNLVLVRSDGEGGYTVLTDQLEGEGYFGGSYDADKKEYWFRITSTIQDILLSDDPDYGFELFIAGGSILAQRSILTGYQPDAPVPLEDRMRLVITYTKAL